MKNLSKITQKLIAHAKTKEIYLIIRCQHYKSRYLNVKNGTIDNSDFSQVNGIGIHAFTKQGYMGFASIDTLSDEKRLFACLEAAIQAANTAKAQKFEAVKEIFNLRPIKNKVVQKVPQDPFEIPQKKFEKDLLAFHQKLIMENKGFSVSNSVVFSIDHRKIFRTDGTEAEYQVANSGLVSLISITDKTNINELYEVTTQFGYEVLGKASNLTLHKKMLDNKLQHIKNFSKAKTIRAGNWPILLDGRIAGVFIHEAFGHTAESDLSYHASPLLKNRKINKGKRVAKSYINILDHATKKERGFHPFSSYGIRRKKTIIVRNGKINNLISDVITARKTNSKLIGAARADFYYNVPLPRMTCTQIRLDLKHTIPLPYNHLTACIEKIQRTLKKHNIFEKYPTIIYLLGTRGGNTDPRAGNFQFGSVVSFGLQKDSISLLKPVSFSGITLEALKSVELAFGKQVNSHGLCYKGGQDIIVSEKAPMLLLSPNTYVTVG